MTKGDINKVIFRFNFADKLGPLNMQIHFTVIASILAFSWINITETPVLVVFCVLYGSFSGTFVF